MHTKGPAYNPAETVAEAINTARRLGRSTEQFFECAQRQTRAPFDARSAAAEYHLKRPGYTIPAAAVTFADWVVIQTEHKLRERFSDLLDHTLTAGKRTAYA